MYILTTTKSGSTKPASYYMTYTWQTWTAIKTVTTVSSTHLSDCTMNEQMIATKF